MRQVSPASGAVSTPPAAALLLSQHLAALTRFDGLARRESNLQLLLQEACRSAAEAVGAGFAGVLQYRVDEQAFVLQAGVGMHARFVGRTRVAADLGTTAGLAWHTGQLVHFRDPAAGGRLRMLDAAIGHGVHRLVSVPVHGDGGEIFGVLEVGSAEAGEFAPCDLAFLRGLAECIGAAVERHADRARRADWATLVAERRAAVREPQRDSVRWPEIPAGPDAQRRTWGGGDGTGLRIAQNAAKRRQAPTFGGLQQDAQMQDGSG